jgi:hypothetical protein
MGIRLYCPNGHKLNVKEFLAGRRGICPHCGASFEIPTASTRPSSKELRRMGGAGGTGVHEATPPPGPEPLRPASPAGLPSDRPPQQTVIHPRIDILSKPPGGPMASPPAPPGSGASLGVPQSSLGVPGPTLGAPEASLGVPKRPGVYFPPANRAPDATPGAPPAGVDVEDIPFEEAVSADLTEAHKHPMARPAAIRVATEPADPLTEAPEAVWYVRPPSGGQYGPATNDLMRAWVAEGRVSGDSLVWREGWRDWQVASDVFAQLRPAELVPGLDAVLAEEARSMPTHPGFLGPGHNPAPPPDATVVIVLVIGAVAVLLTLVLLWVRS